MLTNNQRDILALVCTILDIKNKEKLIERYKEARKEIEEREVENESNISN